MIEVPLPPGIERRSIGTRRGPVAALYAQPERPGGRASVMVCGFMGTKEDFRQVLPLLARAGYDAWAYDHPGQHGGGFAGAAGDGPGRYTIASLAGQLGEFVEAVSPGGPAHLVGHCFGGFIARRAALAAPGRTRTLTMLSCGPGVRGPQALAMVAGIDDLLARGGAMVLWPLLKRTLPRDDQVTRDFWHAKLATVNPHYVTGVAQSLADETDRSEAVAAAGIRSLVMHGSREKRLWRPEAYAEMARDLRAELVVIDQASHHANMQQPEATARNLAAFWAREKASAAAAAAAAAAGAGAGAGGS